MKKLSLILALMLIASSLSCALTGVAFAASETVYTSVIEDLSKDETFAQSNYPAKTVLSEGDKVMDVFQIAESNAGELFLYVYQPIEGKFTASEVRISQTIGEDLAPNDYKLTLLNRTGTLEKYKVEELQLSSDAVRHYLIVQLARPYDKDLDGSVVTGGTITGATQNGNIINTVAYAVSALFTACTVDNIVTYSMEYYDYITVTAKKVGYLRYKDSVSVVGLKLGFSQGKVMDSHYVAFATDKPMDKLSEIDIAYDTVEHIREIFMGVPSDRETSVVHVPRTTFKADNYSKVDLKNKHYEWLRIQKLNDFISTEPTLTDNAKKDLDSMTWVLRFLETDVSTFATSVQQPNAFNTTTSTRVKEVTILRLKFDLEGTTYNLGVVDNKQSERPNQKPDNETDTLLDRLLALLNRISNGFNWLLEHWWYIIIGAVVLVVVILTIVAIVKFGIRVVGNVLWLTVKWTVFLPFTLLYYGIKKNKE